MALASHDPALIEELELLAWRYLERAADMEAGVPPPGGEAARPAR